MLRRALLVVGCFAVAILKFVIMLSSNLCFVSEVRGDNGVWADRIVQCVRLLFLLPRLRAVFAHEQKNSSGMMVGNSGRLKVNTR